LVVVWIAADRLPENFCSAGRVTKMRVDISEQRQKGIIVLSRCRSLLGSVERRPPPV
jgi:hypothetical protein